VEIDGRSNTASTTISVLTYNVEGLPWPARSNRAPRLREIARQLSTLRTARRAPDVVLLQEVFTSEAGRIALDAGYLNRLRGPGRRSSRPSTSEEADPALVKRRKLKKGEGLGRLLSSGLYVLSDFPVLEASAQPFRSRECAGFDCLANKGIQHVRLQVPGVPRPLDLFNTHLNSRTASGVSDERSLKAHRLQSDETSRFIESRRDPRYPMIFGGDFNMRDAQDRFDHFSLRTPYKLVHQYCVEQPGACEVTLSWDGDTPWMDTQDLLGFEDGEAVTIRPVKVSAMFDAPWNGRPLADHDGLLVVYRISWPADAPASAASVPACQASSPGSPAPANAGGSLSRNGDAAPPALETKLISPSRPARTPAQPV
jgi:endonuclease/exonuclease/phosphatase family metal-dependent hydrolase